MSLPQYLRRDLFRAHEAIAMTRAYLVNGMIVPHSHDFVEMVLVMAGKAVTVLKGVLLTPATKA